ncbi:MAG: DNA polymerase III subunit delta [Deltaproteobacteria bacterium]|nr:DNA polymerase III subunit delta [Deltaproteobacteria bacterium]
MLKMDILTLDKELRAGKIRPAYLITGDERHLALTAKQHILKTVFRDSSPAIDAYDAQKTAIGALLDAYRTPSMFNPWRCLVVESAEKFNKEDWEPLIQVLQDPPPKAVLILIGASVRATTTKKFPASVAVVECKKLYSNQVPGWLNMTARDLGVPISQEAAQFLIDCVGTELGILYQTLEQLKLYVGNRPLIQMEDVETVAAKTAQKTIFDLTRAIGEKKPQGAIRLLNKMEEQGEEPLRILVLIARHLRILARTQEILTHAQGGVPPDFAKQIGVHPFFAKEYLGQARGWPARGWAKSFSALNRCDLRLKSSRNKPYAVMEKLIWELCHCEPR